MTRRNGYPKIWYKLDKGTHKKQGNLIFVVRALGGIILGRLVGKIIIRILSFRISISKNINIDHGVTQTCAIMSPQVTYETNHIFVLCYSTILNSINFLFFMYFTVI